MGSMGSGGSGGSMGAEGAKGAEGAGGGGNSKTAVRRRRGGSPGAVEFFRYLIKFVAAFDARFERRCSGTICSRVKQRAS